MCCRMQLSTHRRPENFDSSLPADYPRPRLAWCLLGMLVASGIFADGGRAEDSKKQTFPPPVIVDLFRAAKSAKKAPSTDRSPPTGSDRSTPPTRRDRPQRLSVDSSPEQANPLRVRSLREEGLREGTLREREGPKVDESKPPVPALVQDSAAQVVAPVARATPDPAIPPRPAIERKLSGDWPDSRAVMPQKDTPAPSRKRPPPQRISIHGQQKSSRLPSSLLPPTSKDSTPPATSSRAEEPKVAVANSPSPKLEANSKSKSKSQSKSKPPSKSKPKIESVLPPSVNAGRQPAPATLAPTRPDKSRIFLPPTSVTSEDGSSSEDEQHRTSPVPPAADRNALREPVVAPPQVEGGQPLVISAERAAKTASFHNVTPGVSTREDVIDKLVSEEKLSETDDQLVYRVGPFPQVVFELVEDRVASVVVQLEQAIPPEPLAEELGLISFEPASIPDEQGDLVARVYPERGVYFTYDPESVDNDLRVAQIVIEPMAAAPFVLRARHDFTYRYTENLADLEFALRQDPEHAEAYWMKAEILTKLGRYSDAKGEAAEALRLEPDHPRYRLTHAYLMSVAGQHAQAVTETQRVLDASEVPPEVRALALVQSAELLSGGSAPDYRQAVARNTRAIELATPRMRQPDVAARRLAKEAMIRAHLSIAQAIAWGEFRGKQSVLAKWTDQAAQLTEQFVRFDRGHPTFSLDIHSRTLAAAGVANHADASVLARAVDSAAQELLEQYSDPLFQESVCWQLGKSLAFASEVQLRRADYESVRELSTEALRYLVRGARHRELTMADKYRLARLYYVGGASHALGSENHAHAVAWYDQIARYLTEQLVHSEVVQEGDLGDQLISMGVSYWETGERDRALEGTERGLKLIQEAVRKGQRPPQSLAIPYGNLATMHQERGNAEKAKQFAALAKQSATR